MNAASSSGVRGLVLAAAITDPSNWRASRHLDAWLKARGIVGLTGVDTRAHRAHPRPGHAERGDRARSAGLFDIESLKARAPASVDERA